MHEFERIQHFFAPLATKCEGALGLRDDAAVLAAGTEKTIVTTDSLVESVHFFPHTPPALIAQKALRRNLSDLAAMGATPHCYFLNLMLPETCDDAWLADFCAGLAADQSRFNIALAGGDSTRSATLAISITALGSTASPLRRSGAQTGDGIYVSGTLGDAALGLVALQQKLSAPELIARYHLPEPRMELSLALAGCATACIDVSDGLWQDAEHLCAASNVGAVIYESRLPRSHAATQFLAAHPEHTALIYSGGDDYELLFTLPDILATQFKNENITRIGEIVAGAGVQLIDHSGDEIISKEKGFRHA